MTLKLGLIGYPITHSLSPWIHNEFLKKTGLEGSYELIEIKPEEEFSKAINKLKESGITGFNITVPYKETIIPYLDEIDLSAKAIGAVNTVVNRSGKWIGFNTDGIGYVRSLKQAFPILFQKDGGKVLIIGAGGAARGIFHAILKEDFAQVDIANRTRKSALEIVNLNHHETKSSVLTLETAEENLNKYDLVIQTTSVGMKPHEDKVIISLNQIKASAIASDIVYQPLLTTFLTRAQENGAHIHFGHTMLLYQAQYAFEIWTGKLVDASDMEQQLKDILEGR